MKALEKSLEKLAVGDRAQSLSYLIVAIIMLPGLLVIQLSDWFIVGYLLSIYFLWVDYLREYWKVIRVEIIVLSVITAISLYTQLFVTSDGKQAFVGFIQLLVGFFLIHRMYNLLVKSMKI
jgi:hypothetical protein